MADVAAQFREYIRLDRLHRTAGLTAADLERWKRLKRGLAKRFSPELSDERADERDSVRVPTHLRVDFSTAEALRTQVMTNISRGGLFVVADQLLEIGTRLMLHLTIESRDDHFEVPAEVVSHNVGPNFGAGRKGMGLRFGDMDPEVRKHLESLYDETLRRALASGRKERD